MSRDVVDVAIVGGGPAGASAAALLARCGHEVVVLERSPVWRWRAGGVFASPAIRDALLRIGLPGEAVERVARPIPAMRLETPGGARARLTYGDDGSLRRSAVGLDRSALDPALLALARQAGASVREGAHVTDGQLDGPPGDQASLTVADGTGSSRLRARFVVGADGIRSSVARLAGVERPARRDGRIGLTFHVADPRPASERPDARMIVLDRAYCGLAPIPDDRLNVGIVLAGRRWRTALARDGAAGIAARVLRDVPKTEDDPVDWSRAVRLDAIAGAAPIGHRATRRAGDGWVLVGDAAGFLDPFTGEGLHRAIVSAELAAEVLDARLRGRVRSLRAYEQAMRHRFGAKDIVSQIVLSMLDRPPLLEYTTRRLAQRPDVRETMGLVMGDLIPASRALDPRFLAALLRP